MLGYIEKTKKVGLELKKRVFDIGIKTKYTLSIPELMEMTGSDINMLIRMMNRERRRETGVAQYTHEEED